MTNLRMSREEFEIQYAIGVIEKGDYIEFMKRYPRGGHLLGGNPIVYGCVVVRYGKSCFVCEQYADQFYAIMNPPIPFRKNYVYKPPTQAEMIKRMKEAQKLPKCITGGPPDGHECYGNGDNQTIYFTEEVDNG